MENSLFPAFMLFAYHSDKAFHKMTLPTREWQSSAGVNGKGGYEAWSSASVDAQDMAEGLAAVIADFYPAQVTFDNWSIYTLETPTSPPILRAGNVFTGLTGGAVTPGWYQAVQCTLTAKDTEYKDAKLTLLDCSSLNNFSPVPFASLDAKVVDIFDEWTSTTNAWASRNGQRPATFKNYRATLNAKLEAQYWG